jgi:flavin reductase (DIM6/NTAB) family NADH-FMN oxidoreductase RutF
MVSTRVRIILEDLEETLLQFIRKHQITQASLLEMLRQRRKRLLPSRGANVTSRGFTLREFRDALARFATGVTVVTALDDGKPHGMTANAFASVSLEPPLVLVSLDNRSHMHRILPVARRYGISVLAEDQQALSDHFAGRTTEDARIRFISRGGTVLLGGAVAYFAVEVVDIHPAGDHTLYVGAVEYFECREDKPLLFFAGKYQRLLIRSVTLSPLSVLSRWIRSAISWHRSASNGDRQVFKRPASP